MASSRTSLPQHKKPFSIDHGPKSLKDFLNDPSNSCSSSGFKSFPRHLPIGSRKPTPDAKRISAFQSLIIKAVKNLQFITAVKHPSFLPRSLSRRLSRKASKSKNSKEAVKISVRVKDILRWTSFRDVADVQEKPQPLDFSCSPNRCTTTTTRSANSFCTTNNSSSNFSWCESDFTAEFLPSPSGAIIYDTGVKKLPHVGVDSVTATPLLDLPRDPQDEDMSLYDEEEQQSPVSVFDFQFGENEEPLSPFDQSLANVERTKNSLIEKIKEFESLSNLDTLNLDKLSVSEEEEEECVDYNCEENIEEERARELLVYVKATSSNKGGDREDDRLLLDFFRDELRGLKNDQSFVYNSEIARLAKTWLRGGCNGIAFEYAVNREACIRELNKVADWSKFEGEQKDLALEIGDGILEDLVDELLVDLLVN